MKSSLFVGLLIPFLIAVSFRCAQASDSRDFFSPDNSQVLDRLVYERDGTSLDFEDRLKLSAILSNELGMTPVLQGGPNDLTFLSFDLQKLVILKSGLKLPSNDYDGVVLKTHAGYVFHDKSRQGASFALFFSGVPEGSIQSIIGRVKEQLVSDSYDFRSHAPALFAFARRLWIADAQAECTGGISNQDLWDQVAAVNSSKEMLINAEGITILKGIGSCLKKGGKGVYDGTIGAAVDVGKAVYHGAKGYVEHVMQDGDVYMALADSAGDFWESASSEVKQMVKVVKFLTVQGGFKALPMQDKIDLACQIAGTALPTLIVTLATAGGASETVLALIKGIVKTLIEKLPRLARVIEGIASVIEVVGKTPKEWQLIDFQKKVADFVKDGRALSPEEVTHLKKTYQIVAEIKNKAGQVVAVETKEAGIMTSVANASKSASGFSKEVLAVYKAEKISKKTGEITTNVLNEVKGPGGETLALEMKDGQTLAQVGGNVKRIRPFTAEEVSSLERNQKVIRKIYNSAGDVIGVETAESGLVVQVPNSLKILMNPFADNSTNFIYDFLRDSFGFTL
jgi:hypothetical protein